MKGKYWVKGGKIALAVVGLSMVFGPIILGHGKDYFTQGTYIFVSAFPIGWFLDFLSINIYSISVIILMTLAFWFGVGALFGFIYGKIKKRHSISGK